MTAPANPLDGALWAVRHAFPVFPADSPLTRFCTGIGRGHDPRTCTDRGKHPCAPFGRVYTLDEQQVRRWFGGQPRNVAIAVGQACGPDGESLLVVDSDRAGAIEDTAAAYGQTHTPTMRVRTAKGYHDYYWLPSGVRLGNGVGELRGRFDGDVRSGNAYVLGPGSLHATGVVYGLDDPERPPVPVPDWLLRALLGSARTEVPRAVHSARPAAAAGRRSAALTGLVRFVLDSREGQRNERLYWAAVRAFEHARAGLVGEDAVAGALVEAAVHTGLSEPEAARTVGSARNAAGAGARA